MIIELEMMRDKTCLSKLLSASQPDLFITTSHANIKLRLYGAG